MTAHLELKHDGQLLVVTAVEAVIGRTSACAIRAVHPLVSRRHVRIQLAGDGLFAEDLGSSNGTYLNDQRLTARTRLNMGDTLRVGLEGPKFVVVAARVDGRDLLSRDSEEMQKTMMAGDPRALGARAQVAVAPSADDLEEPPTRAVESHAGIRDSQIPIASPLESIAAPPGWAPGDPVPGDTVDPEPPTAVAAPRGASQNRAGRTRELLDDVPASPFVEPPTQVISHVAAPPPQRGSRFGLGLVVGIVAAAVVVAALAVATPLVAELRAMLPGAPR